MRLTRPNVTRLTVPAGKTEIIVFDETLPGFGVRVRLGGKRTWIAQYRLGSKQRRVTPGTNDSLDPQDPRRRAKAVLGAVHTGDDPQARKAAALDRGHGEKRRCDRDEERRKKRIIAGRARRGRARAQLFAGMRWLRTGRVAGAGSDYEVP